MTDAPSSSDATSISDYLDFDETVSSPLRSIDSVFSLTTDPPAIKTLTLAPEFDVRARSSEGISLVSHASILSAAVAVGLQHRRGARVSMRRFVDWLLDSKVDEGEIESWLQTRRRAADGPTALTAAADRVIERAVSYAGKTIGKTSFYARHLLAALLTPTDDPVVERIARAWNREFRVDLGAFRDVLLDYIETRYRSTSEDMEAWREILRRPPIESVEPQSDEPTTNDQLGRRLFAQALVERMDRLSEREGHDGFAVHIYAPWGAGKTSVLKMMHQQMISSDRNTMDGKAAPSWTVVLFNAWQHERRNPPWWPLIEAVKTECLGSLLNPDTGWRGAWAEWRRSSQGDPIRRNLAQAILLQAHWLWWKVRIDVLPYLIAIAVAAICLWLLGKVPTGNNAPAEWVLKLLTTVIAVFTAFFTASRVAIFGSASAAKYYEDISQDPLKRITHFFRGTVKKTGKPVCVFVDDLDRCQTDYVVDLLEGIQTSFRCNNVAYVVAADRNWLKASFESRYGAFSNAIGNAGQPLGYLFLEKIFQVSTPLPGMGDKTRSAFWSKLLRRADGSSPSETAQKQFDRAVEAKRKKLREKHGESLTGEKAKEILDQTEAEEDRAAVVLELNASPATEQEARHLLEQFTTIVPDNPRVMKRMINAFAMRQAIGLLERSLTPTDALARWTILEQRFPALADLLIEHPEWIGVVAAGSPDADQQKLPPPLMPFADSEIVRNIVGKDKANALTVDHIRAITRGLSA
jgi:hypothetical protein